jgi:hypothetical protein
LIFHKQDEKIHSGDKAGIREKKYKGDKKIEVAEDKRNFRISKRNFPDCLGSLY